MVQIEKQLVQAIQILTPEQQQTVLDFAKFLQTQQAFTGSETSVTQDDSDVLPRAAYDGRIDLAARGIGTEQATELRSRLKTFAEDWNSPEMSAYDEV